MANAASTPEFKAILNHLYGSGKYRTSGEVLSEAWRVWRRDYGVESSPEQKKRAAIKASFRNPSRKRKGFRLLSPQPCDVCGQLVSIRDGEPKLCSVCKKSLKKNPSRQLTFKTYEAAEEYARVYTHGSGKIVKIPGGWSIKWFERKGFENPLTGNKKKDIKILKDTLKRYRKGREIGRAHV